ncbi:helix-turn-helix domain-containing protein [Pseudoxanthobacter sp.]|uniref:AraC family transcriptional regulator n=1 Tax=Pseudoxanthobacter sp. TaxID=1925742 RepID=UPI002FE28DD8
METLFSRQSGLGPLAAMLAAEKGPYTLARLVQQSGAELRPDAPSRPLAFAAHSALFEQAASHCGSVAFGLHVGLGMQPADFGPLIGFAQSAPTLAESIRRICRLSALQCNAMQFALDLTDERAVWSFAYHPRAGSGHRQHALHVLPAMIRLLQPCRSGRAGQIGVTLADRHPGLALAVADVLQADVQTGAPRWGVTFPRAWARRAPAAPPRRASLIDVQQHYCPRLPRSAAEAVGLVLEPMVAQGRAGLDEAAFRLGSSRRRLQSRLRREGCHFRDIVAEVRMARARVLLADETLSLVEIALSLGYADQPHFSRAFSARTGLPPGDWRRRNAASPAGRPQQPGGRAAQAAEYS